MHNTRQYKLLPTFLIHALSSKNSKPEDLIAYMSIVGSNKYAVQRHTKYKSQHEYYLLV
jgi:hypothetical protein